MGHVLPKLAREAFCFWLSARIVPMQPQHSCPSVLPGARLPLRVDRGRRRGGVDRRLLLQLGRRDRGGVQPHAGHQVSEKLFCDAYHEYYLTSK